MFVIFSLLAYKDSCVFTGGKEDKIPSEKCDGAAVVRVVEDLIPSFPKRYCCFSV